MSKKIKRNVGTGFIPVRKDGQRSRRMSGLSLHSLQGFTLIELVISIVIAGIALYSLLFVFITVTTQNVNLEALTTARYLANGKLEEVSSRSYALITSEALSSFGGDFSNFNSTVIVSYVSSEALDVSVGTDYGYKKIIVRVTSGNLPSSIEAQALITDVSNE